LKAADDQTGQRTRCPVCGQTAIVPRSATGPPAEPPPLEPDRAETEARRVPPPLPGAAANATDQAGPPQPPPVPKPRRRDRARRRKQLAAAHAYRPDRGNIQNVHWLAVVLGLAAAFAAAPAAWHHPNLETAPGWARLVLLVAALEAVYIAWMAVTPDWSTVWVVMLVFAFAAAGYGAVAAIGYATPPDEPMPLGMGEVRGAVTRWSASVLLIHTLATYLCGRASMKWRRVFELETAGPRRPMKR